MNNDMGVSIASLQASSPSISQLAGQVSASGKSSGSAVPSQIQETASEFESIFLSLMLKEMRNTLDQEEGGLFGGEGSDTFGGMFDMFMSQHLAESKPLGIGDAIESYMQNSVL